MLKIFKREKAPNENIVEPVVETKRSLFEKLKQSLSKTRKNLSDGLSNLILGKKEIDADLLEMIETRLLLADVGVKTTQLLIDGLTAQISRKEINNPETLITHLKQQLLEILKPVEHPLTITAEAPYVILVVGINGSGKTTTIGKIAHHLQEQGKQVLLAAGDTFRAAAIEQLQVWGERNQVAVVAQQAGADSASVIYDALQSAIAKQYDVLLADTAGRLHTQSHLMEELKKVKRVIGKLLPTAPHEVLLVLDASIGQNALTQAKLFMQAVDVSGIVLTKLDGTAKGGIIFAIANELKLPIRFIGVGEGMHDLKPFDAANFVAALFSEEENNDHI